MSLLLGCVVNKLIVILLMIVFILSTYCPLSCTLFTSYLSEALISLYFTSFVSDLLSLAKDFILWIYQNCIPLNLNNKIARLNICIIFINYSG